MDTLIAFLINYGYWGMLLSAVLAGSVIPFSSEAVMVGLQAAGLKAWPLILYGTVGNVMGGMINYGVGRLGRTDWIEKYLHVNEQRNLWLDEALGWAFSPSYPSLVVPSPWY